MTLEEFQTKILSEKEKNELSHSEIEVFYELSNKIFDVTFQSFLMKRRKKILKKS